MKIVLDASAAVELSLGRSYAPQIGKFLQDATHVMAPDLFYSEIANAIWKYVRFQNFDSEKAIGLLEMCGEMIDDAIPSRTIYLEAFSCACSYNISVYDAMYIVTARRTGSRLISLDQLLVKAAKKAKVSCARIHEIR